MTNLTPSEILLALVLILPLVSAGVSFIIPERYSWATSLTAPLLLLVTAILSFVLFFTSEDLQVSAVWFSIGATEIPFSLLLDAASRLMIVVVSTVSFLVHLYSMGYMGYDQKITRYFGMLGLFTFSMLGIVLANQLILTFVFWELMGFSSYMLIGHWMEKPAAARAAQKAFLFNRIGDAFMLIGILITWIQQTSGNDPFWQTTGVICIFLGVVGKSAQLPLSFWLPDAMEGPTPVSALLHAATMVAAGVFLLIRINPLLTEPALTVIAITGIATALFGAVCALNQFDIKKILAYSTVSQLGLMITAIGLGAKDAALLHLFTHAFFKAGLFLAAGSIIHALSHQPNNTLDVQDIRNLGGLRKKLPVTFMVFCVTGASLAGVPLLSGFLSKDSILTAAWNLSHPTTQFLFTALILIVSFLTVLYTFRMIRFVFLGNESQATLHESPWVMRIPMILCAVASSWLLVSLNPLHISGWFIHSFPGAEASAIASIISAVTVLIALIAAVLLYSKQTSPKTIVMLQNGFGVDSFYQRTIGSAVLYFASAAEATDKKVLDGFLHFIVYAHVSIAHGIAWFDQYIIDGVVDTSARLVKWAGSFTRSFQGGKIQLYIFWAVAGLIIFLFFVLI
ncbi:MAG: NADH-quinone oxidoreductase subunit L [Cyclobacteriaceae bacterium]|nr:NADH-quinone oxidoreductase subunit L [Cyclobacteriaceae bacterium]